MERKMPEGQTANELAKEFNDRWERAMNRPLPFWYSDWFYWFRIAAIVHLLIWGNVFVSVAVYKWLVN